MGNKKHPMPDEVKSIFSDTYRFYLKWIAVKGELDWGEVIAETHDLEAKYPFELCKKMLVELVVILETNYMERSNENGSKNKI